MLSQADLTTLISQQEAALKRAFAASEHLTAAKADLEQLTHYHVLQGLEGSNDRTRQADLASKTEAERAAVGEAEHELRSAKHQLELTSLQLDAFKLKLRLLELARP